MVEASAQRGRSAPRNSPPPPNNPAPAWSDWDAPHEWGLPPADIAPERGLAGWQALLVLLIVAAAGGGIDLASGRTLRGGFDIALIAGSAVAILLVRRRSMFPIVVAPPLVYAVASGVILYFRSNGLHNRGVLIDAASSWLVYGFPSIAAASAAVVVIALVRGLRGRSARRRRSAGTH